MWVKGRAIKKKKLFLEPFLQRSKFQRPLSSRDGEGLGHKEKNFFAASLNKGQKIALLLKNSVNKNCSGILVVIFKNVYSVYDTCT